MRLLVTGGCGFIGSAVVRLAMNDTDWQVLNLDKLTYGANPQAVAAAAESNRYQFAQVDINDAAAVRDAFAAFDPDAVAHLAAETHVDRSIDAAQPCALTNVVGTVVLLETACAHWRQLPAARRAAFRFLHVSTDEVFGSLALDAPPSDETSGLAPNSPYAASKAAAEHFVRAAHITYGLPALISRSSNNYGPWQFPEKLIPLMIGRAVGGATLPVYGRGENVREWLHVEDHARALVALLRHGRPGASYNVGGGEERRNIELVREICRLLDARLPAGAPHDRLIRFVDDRPGHDLRYALDGSRLLAELDWRPRYRLADGLAATIDWYLANRDWWQKLEAQRGALVRHGRA